MSGAAAHVFSTKSSETRTTGAKKPPDEGGGHNPFARLGRWARLVGRVLLSPFRAFMSLRRSMTWASVTLLLIGIISLNVIWGYPWTGMFSACMSLLFAGFAINRIMRPNLAIEFSLPCSAPAGEAFTVTTHASNRSRLPAIELVLKFFESPRRRRKPAPRGEPLSSGTVSRIPIIMPGARMDISTSLVYEHRGVHRLPDVIVTSMFPFHLFRSVRRYPGEVEIAITPRPLTGDEDAVARTVLNALGGWSHKLLSGDALDYTGSREYVVGMPVRRWDFASWARLGRPIVREFQSPSIQTVMLIVDTAGKDDAHLSARRSNHDVDPVRERVLSLAATAVTELSRKMVEIRMYVTSEPVGPPESAVGKAAALDCEPLLIRLAEATAVTDIESRQRIERVIVQTGAMVPVLVLTSTASEDMQESLPTNVTLLRVDSPLDIHETQHPLPKPQPTRETVA